MKLYDSVIASCLGPLEGRQGRQVLGDGAGVPWPDAGGSNLVLRGEMAYELGGGALAAVSAFGLTSSEDLVPRDEVWLYGPDLGDLDRDWPYARLAFLRVAEEGLGSGPGLYTAIRRIEHTRYKVSPRGYMARVSASQDREPVRVAASALEAGLDFAKVGQLYLKAYHAHPEVVAAKLVFVSLQDFPYGELEKAARRADSITESLDHILKDLMADCATCASKPLCDEVEGLRDLHKKRGKA